MDASTLRHLRSFLFVLAAWMLAGTMIELVLAGHVKAVVQLTPFVLCGAGLLALGAVKLWPSRRTVYILRALMALVACGSVFGVAQHFAGNLEFALETKPGADATRVLFAALTGGNPLLAPGVLAIAAAVAVAATYSTLDAAWDEGRGPLGLARLRWPFTRATVDAQRGEPLEVQKSPSP